MKSMLYLIPLVLLSWMLLAWGSDGIHVSTEPPHIFGEVKKTKKRPLVLTITPENMRRQCEKISWLYVKIIDESGKENIQELDKLCIEKIRRVK